ncbi:condensation protein [Streptomyces sp. LX-29]|uniref:condensation protein n=1 Tax=Streptomyces sp. LX-29 TaxID=2900152 RepID=UPI00240DA435|nr:condensation protein [Streptomyces sp. LX-29]WFB09736.1 condensation protein [Streptomyces sp. LX-29]
MTAERSTGSFRAAARDRGHRAPRDDRFPFPTVDEVSRHCQRDDDPENVHIEVHLPGRLDPARLRAAFHEALRRHPGILVREAPGGWWRLRYVWERTGEPDVDPVRCAPPGPRALALARARAVAHCPPLAVSPPVRLELVSPGPGETGSVLLLTINHTALDGPSCLRVLATAAALYGAGRTAAHLPAPRPAAPGPCAAHEPRAVSGPPSAPRTAPVPTPAPAPAPASAPPPRTPRALPPAPSRRLTRPARVAADTRTPGAAGNGLFLADLPLPPRPAARSRSTGAAGAVVPTVNDQLLVATCLTIARWNRLHGRPPRPVRITMPVDDRPRGAVELPIGNGTRLVEVGFGPGERTDAALLSAERPDPAAVARLLEYTAARTRALKAASGPQLGRAGALLTAPVLPVGLRAAVTRGLRRVAAPWTATTLLSNLGRLPDPLDFGDAGRATAVWLSAPTRPSRGVTFTCASTGGRLHLGLRWSRAVLDDAAGDELAALFARSLAATAAATTPPTPEPKPALPRRPRPPLQAPTAEEAS